jgi:hypothetical protein
MASDTPQANEPTSAQANKQRANNGNNHNGNQGQQQRASYENRRPNQQHRKTPLSQRQLEINKQADAVARKLSETNGRAIHSIQRIIRTFGEQFTLDYVQQALAVEAAGGMMTIDKSRRRTPGGVFFYLVKQVVCTEDRADIFPDLSYLKRRLRPPSPYPEMPWEERVEHLQPLFEAEKKGSVEDVTIQIKGRPGEIERRSELVIITLEHNVEQLGAQPRGIPEWPENYKAVTYTTLISERMWEQVERPLRNEKDFLIVDGQFAFDAELGTVVVFATHITTDGLEKKEKQRKHAEEQRKLAQQQKQQQGKKGAAKPKQQKQQQAEKGAAKPKQQKQQQGKQKQQQQPAANGVPAEIVKRVSDLRKAKSTLEQKIAQGTPGPALKMTEKMLANTQKQIEQFESQYPGLKKG